MSPADPISCWLSAKGIDPMASAEALALLLFLVLLYGVVWSLVSPK